MDKSIIYVGLRNVVRAINKEFRHKIQWPRGACLVQKMNQFQEWCGLPSMVGAIDGTHFDIQKPIVE